MTFNIHQQVFDRDGMPLEKKAGPYLDHLMELFVQSPEGQVLWNEGLEPGWASMMMDFGLNYLSVTPPQMTPDSLREILFDLVPRQVSASADEAKVSSASCRLSEPSCNASYTWRTRLLVSRYWMRRQPAN